MDYAKMLGLLITNLNWSVLDRYQIHLLGSSPSSEIEPRVTLIGKGGVAQTEEAQLVMMWTQAQQAIARKLMADWYLLSERNTAGIGVPDNQFPTYLYNLVAQLGPAFLIYDLWTDENRWGFRMTPIFGTTQLVKTANSFGGLESYFSQQIGNRLYPVGYRGKGFIFPHIDKINPRVFSDEVIQTLVAGKSVDLKSDWAEHNGTIEGMSLNTAASSFYPYEQEVVGRLISPSR